MRSNGVTGFRPPNTRITPLLRLCLFYPCAVRLKLRQMFFRPSAKPLQWLNQCASQSRERIFHLRRHDGMHDALHQAVALEAAQSLGEHFLRNPADFALKCGVPHRAARENLDYERSPFVSNPVKHEPGRTPWIEHGRNGRAFWHRFCVKQLLRRCKPEGNIPNGAYSSRSCVVDSWFQCPKLKHEHHSSCEKELWFDGLSFQ